VSFKRGIFVSNYDAYADPRRLVELARAAERGGWAGFFIWDHVWFRNNKPVADPWVVLAAVAATCPGLVVGPLITPLARRRPWKVAREVVTLQGLAEDVVLGVGLGVDEEYRVFEQEQVSEDSRRERGDRLDEALDVLERCWSGADVAHRGRHYDVRNPVDDAGARIEVRFTPVPPRPVRLWGAARVGADDRPYRRAGERLDGIVPVADKYDPDAPLSAADLERVAERGVRPGLHRAEPRTWAAGRQRDGQAGRSRHDVVARGPPPRRGARRGRRRPGLGRSGRLDD
jgi:alkanesulfonate monooxygenase SsuD/methylene tetrahydromethanopterin reductase-like flavin-dependent oxidoreductase (luciferase family)